MENELILLDTDFIIEYLYNNPEATDCINQNMTDFFIIGLTTISELAKGTQNKQQQQKTSKQLNPDFAIDSLRNYQIQKRQVFE